MDEPQMPVTTITVTEEDVRNARENMVFSLDSFTYQYGLGCRHRYQVLLVDRGEDE
jgi:hypothetical protein